MAGKGRAKQPVRKSSAGGAPRVSPGDGGRGAGPGNYLIVQDEANNVYLITPDRLGAPVVSQEVDDALQAYFAGREGPPLQNLKCALLLNSAEAIFRLSVGHRRGDEED